MVGSYMTQIVDVRPVNILASNQVPAHWPGVLMIMEGASRRRKLGDLLPPKAKHADLIKLLQSSVVDLIQGLA